MNLKNFNEGDGMEKLHKFFNLWWSFLCLKKTVTNPHLLPMNILRNNIPADMSVNVYISDWLVAK